MKRKITDYTELEQLVLDMGFLPFFRNDIPDFSVEEYTPPELWFPDDEELDGPWEWKGPVAVGSKCVYGKFFGSKAGFVSLEWFPDLANYRRDGYDFDARYDEGLAQHKDKQIWEILTERVNLLTKELKGACGYGKDGQRGFETVITRLQMQTYVNVQNFEYSMDKHGKLYGWGMARYTTPEAQFGADKIISAYAHSPVDSKRKIFNYLVKLLPGANEKQMLKVIG